jgi:aryl-alcohol dehydrogenase-like predicted oxidoreductase
VAYSPLGRGFLSGRFKKPEDLATDDYRRNNPRFQGENFSRNLALAEAVQAMAREKKCTPSQLALAWVLVQGEDIVPIPGTKRRRYIEENAKATEVVLSPEELRRIDRAIPRNSASGLRYPEAGMKRVNL